MSKLADFPGETRLLRIKLSAHLIAVLQAVLVTFLWSTSWVLIKLGLQDNMPPLTFAGLRYSMAFLCLTPLAISSPRLRSQIRALRARDWLQLILLGVVFYTLTQGTQFLSLAYLPAAMASLLLNLTPVVVGFLGIFFLGEAPEPGQWLGIAISVIGLGLYFLPAELPPGLVVGIAVALFGVFSNAGGALLGRSVNQNRQFSPLLVTFVSMGFGAVLLMITGLLFQGIGPLGMRQWLLVAWLALVNTAFAFTLWNRTLQVLSAVESSILNGLMLPQIALLAWLFLGETLSAKQISGLALVSIGTLIVQLRRTRSIKTAVGHDPSRNRIP